MEGETPKLYHFSVLTQSGVTIYKQQLTETSIDQSILDSISTIALGFKNTMDLSLSSINYQEYTIYFRRGANFLAVLLANTAQGVSEIIDRMFTDLLEAKILGKFIEYANHDMVCDNLDIMKAIKKILYNLDFVSSLSDIKQEFASFRRF